MEKDELEKTLKEKTIELQQIIKQINEYNQAMQVLQQRASKLQGVVEFLQEKTSPNQKDKE